MIHNSDIPQIPGGAFYAVFDGHAGGTVSKAASAQLLATVLRTEAFQTGGGAEDALAQALYAGLLQLDYNLIRDSPALQSGLDISGSTCISAFVTPKHFVIANVGDSRLVLGRSGKVVFSTKDHKPTDPAETARINAARGFVAVGRVNGILAVSRALGDYSFKRDGSLAPEQFQVSPAADTTVLERNPKDQVLIIGCDGIWDVCRNEQALDYILKLLKAGNTPQRVAERLLDWCLKRGSRDNMSVIIVVLDPALVKKSSAGVVSEVVEDPEANDADLPNQLHRGRGSIVRREEVKASLSAPADGDTPRRFDEL